MQAMKLICNCFASNEIVLQAISQYKKRPKNIDLEHFLEDKIFHVSFSVILELADYNDNVNLR